jgi:YVTN family beta-propeller protein
MNQTLMQSIRKAYQDDGAVLDSLRAIEDFFESSDKWHELANLLRDKRDFTLSEQCYQQALQLGKYNAAIWADKSLMLLESQRNEEAISCIDKAIELDPAFAKAWLNKGLALSRLGRYDEAIKCYDHTLKIDPFYWRAWYSKGNALMGIGNYEEAVSCFDKVTKNDPFNLDAWYAKGLAFYRVERYEEAAECFEKIEKTDYRNYTDALIFRAIIAYKSGEYENTLRLCDEVNRIDPTNSEAWYNKGIALYNLGKYKEALECFEKTTQLQRYDSKAWYYKGLSLENLGRQAQALKSYAEATIIDPTNSEAWYNKGIALYNLGKYKEALECFEKTTEIDPTFVKGWNYSGFTAFQLQDFNKSIEYFNKVLALSPKYRPALYQRAYALIRLRMFHEADKCVDEMLELNPKDIETLIMKGWCVGELGDHQEALSWYDKVIKMSPNNVDALASKGTELQSLGRFEEAIKSYDRVIEIDPKNVNAWLRRSDSLYRQGKYEEAIKSYDRVIEIDPKNVNALNGKALALEGLDNYEEAIKLFSQAIENDPNNLDALNNKADALIIMGEYEEAQGCYMKVLQIDPKNLVALMGLHLLYSNYTFEFDRAISIAQRLLTIQGIPKFKSYLASDLICSGRFRKGRGIAKKLAYLLHEGGIKGDLIARFLVLISYFLQGNKYKGNAEAAKLIGYYRDLDVDVVIQEKLWSSKGLINTIRSNKKIDPNTKSVVYQFIELLQGERDNKTLKTISRSFQEALKEKRKQRNTRLKILLSIVSIAAVVLIWANWNIISNTMFPPACPEEGSRSMQRAELDQYPSSITFNPENDRLYVVNNVDNAGEISGATTDSDNSSITVICANNNQEIKHENIRGMAGVSGVAVNPNTNTIYVANNSSNTVSVMHGESRSITETVFNTEPKNIGVGGSPMGVAVDADENKADGNKAYVINEKSKTVSVIDDDTKIGQDIELKHSPTSITVHPDTNKVYVSSNETNTVYVIDGNRNTIEDSIKVGINPTAIAVNPNTNMIYVVNRFSNSISVINGNANNQVIERVVGQDPLDIAINSRNNMVYVVNNQSLSISVINGTSSDNNVIQTISLGERLSRDFIFYDPTSIEINPDTDMLFVTMAHPSLQNHRVEPLFVGNITGYGDELPLLGDRPRGLALDAQKDTLYVTNYRSNTISVVDTRNNVVKETIPVGERPSEVVIDQGKERIYVINCKSNNISIVDTRQNVKKDIDVGKCPWSIAQDPDYNTIYVANVKDSTVSVINSSTTEVVKTIAVDDYPTDIWINPESHLVYVTVSESNSIHVIKPDLSSAREPFPIVKNITGPSNSVSHPVNVAGDHNMTMDQAYVANLNSSSIWVVDEEKTAIFDQVGIPFPNVVTVDTNHHIVYALAGNWSQEQLTRTSLPYQIYKMNPSATGPAEEVSPISTWEKFATQLADLEVDPNSGTLYATNMQSNSLKIIPPEDPGSISDLQKRELYRLGK